MNHNYCNPTKTSFLYGQSPNRTGNMNDSPRGMSPTAMPKQGIMVSYPKGASPHGMMDSTKMVGKPPMGAKARDGATTVVHSGGGGTTYPKSNPAAHNDSYRKSTFQYMEG